MSDKPEIGPPFSVFSDGKLRKFLPKIYEPRSWGGTKGFPPQFEIEIPFSRLTPEQSAGLLVIERDMDGALVKFVRARSRWRPEVIPPYASDTEQLVKMLQSLDARNLPRDRVFKDHDLRVEVERMAIPEFALRRESVQTHTLLLRSVGFV